MPAGGKRADIGIFHVGIAIRQADAPHQPAPLVAFPTQRPAYDQGAGLLPRPQHRYFIVMAWIAHTVQWPLYRFWDFDRRRFTLRRGAAREFPLAPARVRRFRRALDREQSRVLDSDAGWPRSVVVVSTDLHDCYFRVGDVIDQSMFLADPPRPMPR